MQLYLYCTDYENIQKENLHDLVMYANNDQLIDLFLLNEIEDAVPITGATIYFIVKEKPTDADTSAVINKYFLDTSFPNAISGEAKITLLAEDTKLLEGNYIYQILIKFSGNIPFKVISQGNICFRKDLLVHPSNCVPGSLPY